MIIDFNKGNGGGSGSGSTDLTNYWNSAVTEEHIESAASIVYGSAVSYTDQAVADYVTEDETKNIIESYNYATSGDVDYAIDRLSGDVSGNYALSAVVEEQMYQMNYDTTDKFEQLSGYVESNCVTNSEIEDFVSSAQVQTQIDASISGKADSSNLVFNETNPGDFWFPKWNNQGIITGKIARNFYASLTVNGESNRVTTPDNGGFLPSKFYVPTTSGQTGQILMASGNTPVWIDNNFVTSADVETQIDSAVTVASGSLQTQIDSMDEVVSDALIDLNARIDIISGRTVDLSGYYTSAQTEQAITSKNYVTSAQTKTQIEGYHYVNSGAVKSQVEAYDYATTAQVESAYTILDEHIVDVELVASSGYNELHDMILDLSGYSVSALYTSAQTEQAITSKNYVTSAQVETQITSKNYVTSAQVETQITSKNYMDSTDAQVISAALNDLNTRLELFKPVLLYSGNPGFYAINSSALTTWQVENLDLSAYKYIRFYIKASDIGFNDSNNFTAPMYVDVILDDAAKSSQYNAYLGVTSNICAGNRNRSFTTVAAVDSTKSKVQLLYQTSLWDVSTSSAASDGRYCYKIEGYRF